MSWEWGFVIQSLYNFKLQTREKDFRMRNMVSWGEMQACIGILILLGRDDEGKDGDRQSLVQANHSN